MTSRTSRNPESSATLCLKLLVRTSRHINRLLQVRIVISRSFRKHYLLSIAARSPVLARMLSSQFRETSDNRMKIDDVTQETFEVFLGYLYVEPLPELNQKQASDLMVIADKYEVLLLKEICCGFLQESIKKDRDFDSAVEIFQVAHKHHCTQELIDTAFDVIKRWTKLLLLRMNLSNWSFSF